MLWHEANMPGMRRCRTGRKSLSHARSRRVVAARRYALRCHDGGGRPGRGARAPAARHLDPNLPAMKAHGVPWLIRHLDGEIALAEADRGRQARHPPIHQAAGDLVPQSAARTSLGSSRTAPSRRSRCSCANRPSDAVRSWLARCASSPLTSRVLRGFLAASTGRVAATPVIGVGCDLTASHFH